MNCEQGLAFDSRTNTCIETSQAYCGICTNGDKIALTDECIWYKLCVDGSYITLKCPSLPNFQIFDPETKQCIPKKKLRVPNECNYFKECALNSTANSFERWTVSKCDKLLHFDEIKQECVDPLLSPCGS